MPQIGTTARRFIPATTVTRTSTYTASPGDLVLADATAAGFTVTLPGSAGAGDMVSVKKIDTSTNQVVVLPPSGTIDGDASATLLSRYAGGIFLFDGSNWQTISVMLGSVATSTSAVLGFTSYVPPGEITTTSTTPVDLDATNLKVTFFAPTSGKVLVDLEGYLNPGNTSNTYGWSLRDSVGDVTGTTRKMTFSAGSLRASCRIIVTGLTPGQQYTWKWAHVRLTGSGGPGIFSAGSSLDTHTMIVTALP